MLNRAHAQFEIKSIDDADRVIEGFTSTPTPDRGGDVLDPNGATFTLPLPLLWQHRHDQPIGEVFAAKVTKDGIWIRAKIAKGVLPYIDDAWALIKARLVRGFSVGWKPLEPPKISGGTYLFPKWLWAETSAVTVPMNAQATIDLIKSLDAPYLAATGTEGASHRRTSPGVTGLAVVKAQKGASPMARTITEQIADFQGTRETKTARMSEIMNKAGETGETLDAAQSEEYDTLKGEVDALNKHLARLEEHQALNVHTAKAVNGQSQEQASASRGYQPVIHVKTNLPPGVEFARMVLCKLASFVSQGSVSPMDVAKGRYPDNPRIQQFFQKAAVPAGTTSDPVWAGPLVDPTNLASEFLEFLRPATIIGKFGNGGVPGLRPVPFNVRITGQTSGGNGYWVGQGAPKPLTSFAFNAQTLLWAKVAAIAVITEELARFSSPSAEALVRDALRDALVERLDIDFIDPASAAVAGVQPASITNGLTPLSSSGATADNIRTDIQNLLQSYISSNQNVSGLALIMPNTLALALSLMVNTLGQREFPNIGIDGGNLLGIPVITSQYAANASGSGNLVIAVNTRFVALADDGQVNVDASREASLQMLDNPTNNSSTATPTTMVSMFQTNSIALRAERFINWAVLRAGAVTYMDDVNWGSIGSP